MAIRRNAGLSSLSRRGSGTNDAALLFLATASFSSLIFASPAGAIDCGAAKAPVERLICSDAGLKAADAALSRAYFELLKQIKDADAEAHDLLIKSQKRWIVARDHQDAFFAVPSDTELLSAPRKKLLRAEMDSRRKQIGAAGGASPLLETLRKQREFVSKYSGGAFSGFATECSFAPEGFGDGEYLCLGRVSFQNGSRVCSLEIEWASGHTSEVHEVAEASEKGLRGVAYCETGDTTTDYPCPETDEKDPAARWNRNSAGSKPPQPGTTAKPAAMWKLDPDFEFEQEPWMRACLTNANYPPSQEPGPKK